MNHPPYINGYTPYIHVVNVAMNPNAVVLSVDNSEIFPIGKFFLYVGIPLPSNKGVLPVSISLNGNPRQMTFFGGASVTVADIDGTGVIEVFYDRDNGILQMLSTPAPTQPA